jgi:hypothetical protein
MSRSMLLESPNHNPHDHRYQDNQQIQSVKGREHKKIQVLTIIPVNSIAAGFSFST